MNVTATDIRHKCPHDQPTSRVKSVKYVLGSEGDFFGDLAATFFGEPREGRLHGEMISLVDYQRLVTVLQYFILVNWGL